ncbi:MAG: hypothetical protein ACREFR_02705 [Limisphaerales bacterium]
MRPQTKVWVGWIIPLFLAVTAVSCKKAAENRLAWNLKTLAGAYKQAGHTSSSWDASAIEALTEFARARADVLAPNEPWARIISTNAAAAVQAGCDDPMVRYLFVKYSPDQTNSPETFADQLCDVALQMQKSSYPPIRKFYAAQRAVDQLFYAYGYNTNHELPPMCPKMMALVGPDLLSALHDKSMPATEAFDACDAILASIKGQGIPDFSAYSQAYNAIKGLMFQNWPNAYTTWLLKGEAYVQLAWAARGTGYANTVTPEGAKLFSQRLAIAENALTNAWRMNSNDSRIADHMLEVELGQGEGRDRMELWFNRAMALNPDDYDACATKLLYLQPKWYGSIDDMLEFGHECATNTQWGGNVPLILLDAHYFISYMYTNQADQENYWRGPEVWPDLQTAFKRFFQMNPGASGRYGQYAFYACKCGQWKKFLELVPKVGSDSYKTFGGKRQFDKMVQLARQKIGS